MAKKLYILLILVVLALSQNNFAIAESNDLTVEASNRLSRYAQNYSISAEQKANIAEKCAPAQSKLQTVKQRLDQVQRKRNQTYDIVDADLRKFQAAIAKQNLDTSNIDLMIARYDMYLKNYRESFNNYRSLIIDIMLIDCTLSPELFNAGLQKAREIRTDVLTNSLRIKAFGQTELKNTFNEVSKEITGF